MFRHCWVIFRENFSLPLHLGCALQLSENVLLTVYCVAFGGVNSPRSGPGPDLGDTDMEHIKLTLIFSTYFKTKFIGINIHKNLVCEFI
jgi:hypothetical protein